MRFAFVTPRFRAPDAALPELLASELAERAPGRWVTTVLTTTAGGSSEGEFREGQTQQGRTRVHRFACDDAGDASAPGPAPADRLASAGLLAYLTEHRDDFDLIVLFGCRPALCRAAARIAPPRTVLLPFADGADADDPALGDTFETPAAFLFGSEAEEVRVLKRYGVHRRMRETVGGALMLSRPAAPAEFRRRSRLTSPYLILAGPPEPGRGIEEFLRFFATFKEQHREAPLDLVLFGPAAIRVPDRPDIRVLDVPGAGDRLDAIGGALMAVTPERLATFASAAAEPFSLGTPILVNASASQLVSDCRESNGGLYYQNYDELELILELGLRDPALFGRLGAAGREFLAARSDWDAVMRRYDRAFRSFARPPRATAAVTGAPPPPPPASERPDGAEAAESVADDRDALPASSALEPVDSPPDEPAAGADAVDGDGAGEGAPSPDPAEEPGGRRKDTEERESETGEPALPSFFQSSIRE